MVTVIAKAFASTDKSIDLDLLTCIHGTCEMEIFKECPPISVDKRICISNNNNKKHKVRATPYTVLHVKPKCESRFYKSAVFEKCI
jgi:hypothetical protein